MAYFQCDTAGAVLATGPLLEVECLDDGRFDVPATLPTCAAAAECTSTSFPPIGTYAKVHQEPLDKMGCYLQTNAPIMFYTPFPGANFEAITNPGPIAQFDKLDYTCSAGYFVSGTSGVETQFSIECTGADTWESITMPTCDVAQCSVAAIPGYTVDDTMIGVVYA